MSFIQSIHANISSDHPVGLRPYGQPGQLPKAAVMLPLLIELKAQFYKLVISTICERASTCKTVNKSSKSKYLLYRLCIKSCGSALASAGGQRDPPVCRRGRGYFVTNQFYR